MSGKASKQKVMIKTKRQGAPNKILEEFLKDGQLLRVELSLVRRDENQPRTRENVMAGIEDLAERIKIQGLIKPPLFRIMPDGTYVIIDGERRTEAVRLNGDETILALCKVFEEDQLYLIDEIQYSANDPTNSKDLTPLEDALWWRNYIDEKHNGKVAPAARQMGYSTTAVFSKLRILQADATLTDFINKHVTDQTVATELVSLEANDPEAAKIWKLDLVADNIGNARQSIKKLNKSIIAKRQGANNDAAESNPVPGETTPSIAVKVVKKNTGVAKVVIGANGLSPFLLDEKLLLRRVASGDMHGAYLGRAFLSAARHVSFDGSLATIAELEPDDYQLFYQIIELIPSIKDYEVAVKMLGNKIAALLEVDVNPETGK